MKNLILASLMLVSLNASAQNVIAQDIESWMSSLISQTIDNKVEVSKSLGQERDITKEGTPLKWRCDIMTFTLPKKQRSMLDEMIKAFEANGTYNPNCYGVNTLSTGNPQNEGKRNLMIGDDPSRYVTIGEQYGNYINVNILDAGDTTKTHRYAYALEWKEDHKGNVFARYIVTYAKIPSAQTTTIIGTGIPSNPINPFFNEMTNDDAFIRNFNSLKDFYWRNNTTEVTAIGIYDLCRLGVKFGAFQLPDSTEKWEKVMADIDALIEVAKNAADRKYFEKARELLMQMHKK
ncbi:MAG: hypothetical protein J6Y59_10755 [Bacteroidaceae bacterium]|nr:hypothetical protein [Bacteroidaceae bacterium]